MTTTAPTVGGRAIALAHYAGRAVLETVLSRHGATFQQSVALRVVALADGPVERDQVVEQVVGALKNDEADARRTIGELIADGLVAGDGSRLRITDAGRELYSRVTAETGEISARIYAGIPAADLEAAGRVLARVTERADAELAMLRG
ncbi:MarR family transcriptional regulator [Streptomyces sp. NPDC052309]|uniref:MarR family transcriptional regulator n=1 Tax=Streptomyces sp. NPDC052309 TaxID=3155421 RepID=UPI003424ED40